MGLRPPYMPHSPERPRLRRWRTSEISGETGPSRKGPPPFRCGFLTFWFDEGICGRPDRFRLSDLRIGPLASAMMGVSASLLACRESGTRAEAHPPGADEVRKVQDVKGTAAAVST